MPILEGFGAGVRALRSVGQFLGGTNDSTFATYDFANRFNASVSAATVQSDGKILLGGAFTFYNGASANRLIRLNSDGTVDTAFLANIGTGLNGTANAIAVQSDGKILIGGAFTTVNGVSVNRIVRLNADGTLDTAFVANIGTGASHAVSAITVQSDGKIILGGSWATFNGLSPSWLIRLNSDGTRDTAFVTNLGTAPSNAVLAIAVQSDGKIVLGGAFTAFNGVTVNRIVRLNSNGTRDTAFTTNTGTGANGNINRIVIQSDGKIVVVGAFTTFNSVTVNRIVRLNSDGTRDTAFTTNTGAGAAAAIQWAATQPDGKILICGSFTTFNGVTANRICRLNSDGTRDTAFTTNNGTAVSGTVVNTIVVQSDGKILLAGDFSVFNGFIVWRAIRINGDGTMPTSGAIDGAAAMGSSADIQTITTQPDGKILVGGNFTYFGSNTATAINRIARLASDGTLETSFSTNVGTGPNSTVFGFAVQSDGKIVAIGQFSSWSGVTVNGIVRLNADGTRDTAFTTNTGTAGGGAPVNSIVLQPDGKIVLSGNFSTWNGTTVNYIVRLNSDGTRDTAFTANTGTGGNSSISQIALQSDGKIVGIGNITTFNGASVGRIVRLNSDGTRDTAFTTNNGTGLNTTGLSVAVQPDGKIVVGGFFSSFNGTTVNGLTRLNADGTLDTAFVANAGSGTTDFYAIKFLNNGNIVAGGYFTTWNGVTVNRILCLNSDGTRNTAFTTNTGTAASGAVVAIQVLPDGKILIGGLFTSFNGINRSYLARLYGQ